MKDAPRWLPLLQDLGWSSDRGIGVRLGLESVRALMEAPGSLDDYEYWAFDVPVLTSPFKVLAKRKPRIS